MVGDFVTPDYGWLVGKTPGTNGEYPSARVYFKAGKNRDGYQCNSNIIDQVNRAMDILDRDYAGEHHIFTFDNATIHTARCLSALSVKDMQLNLNPNFLTITNKDKVKTKIKMDNTTFVDGTEQLLYFPDDHPLYLGWFKGMKILIEERCAKGANLPDPKNLKTQCRSSFKKCPKRRTNCCCR